VWILLKWVGYLGIGAAVFLASIHYNQKFLDWIRFQSIGTRDYISEKLSIMFIDIPPHRILLGQILLSVGTGLLVFFVFLPYWAPGILFGLVFTFAGWKAPKPIVEWMYRRRVNKFVTQMIDGLAMMSGGLKSGLSIVQAVGIVAKEMPNPIRQEFELLLNQNKLGVSLEEAFLNLSKRIQSDDVEMFVTSVNILKETGGNLAETFDTIVLTIRERIKVEKKIQALTAQGLYQGVMVMAIPPLLGFYFYQNDPEFMKPMFTSSLGWLILAGIMALMFAGMFVILRIIRIDV
jgi:tight adherence protein B